MPARLTATENGFRFGAMEVFAVAELPQGHTVILVRADGGAEIELYCSPEGRRLRAFRKGKGEMRP